MKKITKKNKQKIAKIALGITLAVGLMSCKNYNFKSGEVFNTYEEMISYYKKMDIEFLYKSLKSEEYKNNISTTETKKILEDVRDEKFKTFKDGRDFATYEEMISYYKNLDKKFLYENLKEQEKLKNISDCEVEQILEDVEK